MIKTIILTMMFFVSFICFADGDLNSSTILNKTNIELPKHTSEENFDMLKIKPTTPIEATFEDDSIPSKKN